MLGSILQTLKIYFMIKIGYVVKINSLNFVNKNK